MMDVRLSATGGVSRRYAAGMALNRLRFHNILVREMGAPSEAAEELAEVVAGATSDLATRDELDTRLAAWEARTRELVWRAVVVIITVLGALGATIIALLIALLSRGSEAG